MDLPNGLTIWIVFYFGNIELARSPLVEDCLDDLEDTCAFIAGGWCIDPDDITWKLATSPPFFASTPVRI